MGERFIYLPVNTGYVVVVVWEAVLLTICSKLKNVFVLFLFGPRFRSRRSQLRACPNR